MAGLSEKVWVTGLGVVTPLGPGLAALAQGLRQGKTGLRLFRGFDTGFSRCGLAGSVDNAWLPKGYSTRLEAMGGACVREALAQASWRPDGTDPWRCGVFVSSSKGGMEVFSGPGPAQAGPGLEKYLSHMPGARVRSELGWRGGGGNYPLACATGAFAMGAAREAILEGRLDAALAGSVEASLTPMVWRSFDGLGALAPCGADAGKLRGAFDRRHNGFVLGEGGGVALLENAKTAKKRGAFPLAELAGWSCTCDAFHITAPDPAGVQAGRALKQALAQAGLSPGNLDYLNAHGTGTRAGDMAEVKAVELALGPMAPGLLVSGTKASTGHLLGAAGAVEAVISVLALAQGFAPPTLGVPDPMLDLPFKLVRGQAIEKPMKAVASLSMGFGGHNVALVFKKP